MLAHVQCTKVLGRACCCVLSLSSGSAWPGVTEDVDPCRIYDVRDVRSSVAWAHTMAYAARRHTGKPYHSVVT